MIFKQETIQSWFSGVGSSINSEVIQPFKNAEQVIWKYNQAIQHNSLTQQGWERLLAQSDDSLKAYLTSIKGTAATMTGYNVSLQGNIIGFKKVSSAITQYNALSAFGAKEQNIFANAVSVTNGKLGTYLTGLKGAKASISGYVVSLVGATVKTVALKVATIALNSAITMGASLIISGLVSAISEWIHKTENMISASEDAIEKIKSINDELKNNQKTISNTAKRYAELAQGVDQLTGKNISLSNEDYEEFLTLSNQLAEMFPTLNRNYNDNGDAIVQLSGDVDTIVGSLQNLIEAQRDLANRQIVDELPTVFDGVAAKSDKYEQQLSDLESRRDTLVKSLGDVQSEEFSSNFMDGFSNKWIEISGDNLEVISQMRDDYMKILKEANIDFEELTPTYEMKDGIEVPVGFTIKINSSDEDVEKAKNTIDGKIQELASQYETDINKLNEEINTTNEKNKANWISLSSSIFAWLSTDDSFKVMDDTMQATVQNIVNSLDWGSLDFSSWEDAKQYIQENILSLFNTTEGKKTLADIEVMFGIQTQFNNGDITVEQYQQKLQDFLNSIENLPPETKKSILLLFGIQTNDDGTTTSDVDTMVENVKKKLKGTKFDDKVGELSLGDLKIAADLKVGDDTIQSWDDLIAKIEEVKNASTSKTDISSFKDAWKDLDSKVKDKLLELAKAGKLTNDTFKKTEGISKFIEQLKALGISAEEAIQKINKKVDSSDQLSAMSSQISKMSDMLADKKNGVTATADDLAGFDVTVKGLDSWNEFERVMGSSTSTIAECKKAANALATEWVNSNNFLANLTNTNKEYYITQLNNMGVENAEAVVTQKLADKKAVLALKEQALSITKDGVTKKTAKEVNKLLEEANASDTVKKYLFQLVSAEQVFNNSNLDVDGKILKLGELASAYGQTALAAKIAAANEGNKAAHTQGSWSEADVKHLQDEINKSVSKPIKVKINPSGSSNYTPPKTTKDKSDKQKAQATAEEFDFIEVKLNKLSEAADKAKNKISEIFSYKDKKTQIQKAIEATTDAIKGYTKAAVQYQRQANKIAGIAKKTTKGTSKDNLGNSIVESAKKYVDKLKYVWGGTSLIKGADCSGFVQQIFKKYGINLPRTSKEQYANTKGARITNRKDLKPGDLVFFSNNGKADGVHHVGVYAGNGKFIHSPQTGKKVAISSLSSRNDFIGGVRANGTDKYKTVKIKGVSSSTIAKYIKLIKNGSLNSDGISKIKNEKLKEFIKDYQSYYEKAKKAKETAEELRKERKRLRDEEKNQVDVDEGNAHLDKLNAEIELAYSASRKVTLEKAKYKWIKESYNAQIKIAKLEKDSVKIAQLRAEKEKAILDTRKQILQYSLDKNAEKRDYLDAKYDNATSAKDKAKISNDKIKTYEDDNKQYDKNYKSAVGSRKSKGTAASKTVSKIKSISDKDMKKINDYIKKNKSIPKSLLSKVKKTDSDLYNKLADYNKNHISKSSVLKSLKSVKSKIDKNTYSSIEKSVKTKKKITNKDIKTVEKKDKNIANKFKKYNKNLNLYSVVSKKKYLTSSEKKKIQSLIKAGKKIPSSLLNKVKKYDVKAYNDLFAYNEKCESVTEALDTKNKGKEENKTNIREEKNKADQAYADEAESRINLNNQLANNTMVANEKNKYEKSNREELKTQYDHLVKIAKRDGDLVEAERLRAEEKEKISESYWKEFENIQNEYNAITELNDAKNQTISDNISLLESQGLTVDKKFYELMMKNTGDSLNQYVFEKTRLEEQLSHFQYGTNEWFNAKKEIEEVDRNIINCKKDTIEFQKAINELDLSKFNVTASQLDAKSDHLAFLVDMLSHSELTDSETGGITNEGLASASLMFEQINNNKQKALNLRREWATFQGQVQDGTSGLTTDQIIEKNNEYAKSIQECESANANLKDSIKDLVKNTFSSYIDALNKLIEKRKKALDIASDLRSYQRQIKDQTKQVNDLKKQISAIVGDASEEARAKIQKLNVQLENAEQDLDDTEYERWKSDQIDILDSMSEELQEFFDNTMKDTNGLLEGIQQAVYASSGIIAETLSNLGLGDANSVRTEENNDGSTTTYFTDYAGGTTATTINKNNDLIAQNPAKDTSVQSTNGLSFIESVNKIEADREAQIKKEEEIFNKIANMDSNKRFAMLGKHNTNTNKIVTNNTNNSILIGCSSNADLSYLDIIANKRKKSLNKFKTGGLISGQDGDDNLILRAANKERVLTPQQNDYWEKWTNAIPDIMNVVKDINAPKLPSYMNTIQSVNRDKNVNIGDISIHLDGSNVVDAESLVNVIQHNSSVQTTIQKATIGQIENVLNNKLNI